VTTWLHRIVVNACLDRLRRRRSRPTVPLPGTDPERGEDTLADPADDIGTAELRHELGRALAELPEDQRMAIVLVDVNGFPVAEAAEVLGVPTGTVKSRCARGRAKLAARLASLRPTPGSGSAANSGGSAGATRGDSTGGSAPAATAAGGGDASGGEPASGGSASGDTASGERNAVPSAFVSPDDSNAADPHFGQPGAEAPAVTGPVGVTFADQDPATDGGEQAHER
jgi:RNA polymerase sigma-70 factor (ECF subfamily)